jgi:hypothetical protein
MMKARQPSEISVIGLKLQYSVMDAMKGTQVTQETVTIIVRKS